MPPVVKLVGNLVKVHETREADMRQLLVDKKKNDGGSLWVLEVPCLPATTPFIILCFLAWEHARWNEQRRKKI